MNILRLEFFESEVGSYNDLIGQLIKKVRYFTTQIPADEIEIHIPEAKKIESKIQHIDTLGDEPHRDYIIEIMDALHIEAEIEQNFIEELAWSLQTISISLIGELITPEDIEFDYMEQRSTYWVEFNGFIKIGLAQKEMHIIKDVFRSVCNKCNIIFIDCED